MTRIHAQAPGDQREREDGGGTPPPGASGGGPGEALAVGHPSGGGIARATRFLPRRVHIPLQPPNVSAPGEALLQARGTKRHSTAVSPPAPSSSLGPPHARKTTLNTLVVFASSLKREV